MFVPISSDVAFVTYTGVVVGLLLLSIALLGHLLGFHIYLSKYTNTSKAETSATIIVAQKHQGFWLLLTTATLLMGFLSNFFDHFFERCRCTCTCYDYEFCNLPCGPLDLVTYTCNF